MEEETGIYFKVLRVLASIENCWDLRTLEVSICQELVKALECTSLLLQRITNNEVETLFKYPLMEENTEQQRQEYVRRFMDSKLNHIQGKNS